MPDVSPGALAAAFLASFLNAFPQLLQAATDALANIITDKGDVLWDQIANTAQNADVNFVTRTPPGLSYNLGGITDMYRQWREATAGVVAISVVLAGIAAIGREYFGWSWTLGAWSGRMFLGIAFATSMPFVYATSITMVNDVCDAITGANLPGPQGADFDPWFTAALLVVWIIFGIRLLVRMGYRLIYLGVLMIVGPLAAYCWTVPQAHSYWSMWVKNYTGLLVGQVLVTICLKLAATMVGVMGGSLGSVALSIGVLLLAYDMATIGADIKGGGLMQVIKQTVAAAAVVVG